MSIAHLSSSSLRMTSRASLKAARGVRFSSGHGGKNPAHLPFSYHNRSGFAVKLTGFMVVSFGVPFLASAWQLKKSGGA